MLKNFLVLFFICALAGESSAQVAAIGTDSMGNAGFANTIGPDISNQHPVGYGTARLPPIDDAVFLGTDTQGYPTSASQAITTASGSWQYMNFYTYLSQPGSWSIHATVRTLAVAASGTGQFVLCRLWNFSTSTFVTNPDGNPITGMGAYVSASGGANWYATSYMQVAINFAAPVYIGVYCARFGTVTATVLHDGNGITVITARRSGN